MHIFKTWSIFRSIRYLLLFILLAYAVVGTAVRLLLPAPFSVGLAGAAHPSKNIRFHEDLSWIDSEGHRQLSQTLFDSMADLIGQAEELIVLDMFLFNDWQGPVPETHRSLSADLVDILIARKAAVPEMTIVFISDPINTVYGGMQSTHLETLRSSGVEVVLTKLESLQDSNPAWSGLWRLLFAPFGNSPGSALPNPFGEGRVSVRSYLALLNFKANHRKLLVVDNGAESLKAMVSSANPHDGSSAHRNVAFEFDGEAASDLLAGEIALLRTNGAEALVGMIRQALEKMALSDVLDEQLSRDSALTSPSVSTTTVRVLSEQRIHDVVMQLLSKASSGDKVDLSMFYLSERKIVRQLIAAQTRGAQVRVLLDVNSDAFGRQKNGVPNRPVAAELSAAGIQVRWCATKGEQCHAKWLHVGTDEEHAYLMGSANFTRRNLRNFNLETNVLVQASDGDPIVEEMDNFFERQWANEAGRTYSVGYETYADESFWLNAQYRFMEATGLSTF